VRRQARRVGDGEHRTIARRALTALADRLRAQTAAPGLPEYPDYPRILAVFNEATGPLWARGVCEVLDHESTAEGIECTGTNLKRLVRIDVPTEADASRFTREQWPRENRDQPNVIEKRTSPHELPSEWAFT
jgi:hypothetical protein